MGELEFQLVEIFGIKRLDEHLDDGEDDETANFRVSIRTREGPETLVLCARVHPSGGIAQVLILPSRQVVMQTCHLCILDLFLAAGKWRGVARFLGELNLENFSQIVQMAKTCQRALYVGRLSREPSGVTFARENTRNSSPEVAPALVPARYMFRSASALQMLSFIRNQMLHTVP